MSATSAIYVIHYTAPDYIGVCEGGVTEYYIEHPTDEIREYLNVCLKNKEFNVNSALLDKYMTTKPYRRPQGISMCYGNCEVYTFFFM